MTCVLKTINKEDNVIAMIRLLAEKKQSQLDQQNENGLHRGRKFLLNDKK
jgi:hypothetical protein